METRENNDIMYRVEKHMGERDCVTVWEREGQWENDLTQTNVVLLDDTHGQRIIKQGGGWCFAFHTKMFYFTNIGVFYMEILYMELNWISV